MLKVRSGVVELSAKVFNLFACVVGWVLIDRSGKHFGVILNYLRDCSVSLPDTKTECEELLAEAK